jgi:hypothetical protein
VAAFLLAEDRLGATSPQVAAGACVTAALPYSGIVCRAALAGTWHFAAQIAITCIVQPFPGIFQRQISCTFPRLRR